MKRFAIVSVLIVFLALCMSTEKAFSYWEFTLPDGRAAVIYPNGEWPWAQIGIGVEKDFRTFDFFYVDSAGNLTGCCEVKVSDIDTARRIIYIWAWCKTGRYGSWDYLGQLPITY